MAKIKWSQPRFTVVWPVLFLLVSLVFYQNCGRKFQVSETMSVDGSLSPSILATPGPNEFSASDLGIVSSPNLEKSSYAGDALEIKVNIVNRKAKTILNLEANGTVLGTPKKIRFEWFKDDQKLGKVQVNGSTFRLQNISENSEGNYSVRAYLESDSNTAIGEGPTSFLRLSVLPTPAQEFSPIVLSQSPMQTIRPGSSTILTVVADGYPRPTFQWKKDGKVLEGQTSDELVLYNVGMESIGIYTCEIKNDEGTIDSSPILVVLSGSTAEPKIQADLAAVYEVIRGTRWTSPKLYVTGFPLPTSTWFKNGSVATLNPSPLSEITFESIDFANEGTYKIEVKNSVGQASKQFIVNVRCPDSFQRTQSNNCIATSISCTVENGVGAKYLGSNEQYGACTIASCNAGYHEESGQCLTNTKLCSTTAGDGKMFWNYDSRQYSACLLDTCMSNTQHAEAGACVENIQTCTVDNGQGIKTWNGAGYSACMATTCNTSYHLNGTVCESNEKACSIPYASTAVQVWNGASYGACTLVSCQTSYHKEGNACVYDLKSCEADGGVGLATWEIANERYGSCILSSCVKANTHLQANKCVADPTCPWSQHLSANRSTCEPNTLRCDLGDNTKGVRVWDTLLTSYSECMPNNRKVLDFELLGEGNFEMNFTGNIFGTYYTDDLTGKLSNHILYFRSGTESAACEFYLFEKSELILGASGESNFSNLNDIVCSADSISEDVQRLLDAQCVWVIPAVDSEVKLEITAQQQRNLTIGGGSPRAGKYRVTCP